MEDEFAPWRPRSSMAFASPHLTTVQLDAVTLAGGLLDFSCCPALRTLAFVRCRLEGYALVSPSLERLAIVDCFSDMSSYYYEPDYDTLYIGISTPLLRFMEIFENYDPEQFLETMLWLTEDSIRYTSIRRIYSGQR